MLNRPGISSEIKQLFIKKHVAYVISFVFIWSIILANALYELITGDKFDPNEPDTMMMLEQGYTSQYVRFPTGFVHRVWVLEDEKKNYMSLKPLQIISFIASILTGVVMGTIRCFEPYFLFILKKIIKSIYGIPLSVEEIDENKDKLTDTIAQFLNSSLNIELVHIILKSVSEQCGKTNLIGDYDKYIPLDSHFEEVKEFKLDQIEIKDPAKWNLLGANEKRAKVAHDKKLLTNSSKSDEAEDDILVIKEDIVISELAPKIFAVIRNHDGIGEQHIIESLSPEFNRDSVFKAGEGQGKSGSFFFFSHDKRFIIKTMNEDEYNTFKGIFKKYFRHVLDIKTLNSLIARIYGIFTVKRQKLEPVRLILMANTVNLRGKKLKYMFDLKGSLINRESKMKKNHNPGSTLKDINLLEIKKKENILKFTPEDKDTIMRMIKRDVPIL